MSAACRDCGADTGIEIPIGRTAQVLARMLRCDECEAKVDEAECERENERRHETHMRRVSERLPAELRGYRFSTSPAPPEAIRAATKWAREGGRLILVGPVGRGKTGLMAAAVWTRLYATDIAWASVPTYLANLMAAHGDTDRERALSMLRGKTSLALDDLDKFNGGDWAASQIFAAIDNAMTGRADLIVTSNKTPSQIAAHIGGDIGPAIASRLASCEVVSVTGPDHRLSPESRGAAA